jgi:hypothetical protein
MKGTDFGSCSNEELAAGIEQLHALVLASLGQMFCLLREFASRQGFSEDGCRDLSSWLVARLGVSRATARAWADTALSLGTLPLLSQLLEEGRVSFDQLAPVASVATPETEEALASQLPGLSASQAEALRRRCGEVDPQEALEAHRSRRLYFSHRGQSTRLSGLLPSLEAELVRAALERVASGYGPDPESGLYESFDKRMADALVELCSSRIAADPDPERANLVIYVEREVLEGAAGPAETAEGAALSAETARRAACDCRFRPLLVEPGTGRLDLGRTTRSIPPRLSRYLRHRDGGCRFPGCAGRRGVQGHHIVHWPKGGPTDRSNLVSLCWRCHHLVHEGGWGVRGNAEGTLEFVSPAGKVLTGRPAPLRSELRQRIFGESPGDS